MEPKEVQKYLQERAFVPDKEYDIIRGRSARNCHNAIIYMPEHEKILLTTRQEEPAKGILWPLGGGQKLGYTLGDASIRKVIGRESGLELSDIEFFGKPVDHIWSKGPKGTPVHDVGNYFNAVGRGKLTPDITNVFRLITPEEYLNERCGMAHWTKVGMDRAVERFFDMPVMYITPFPDFYIDGIPYFVED